jgi:glycosyltransferase involved in cell wall biosynthesis
LSTHDSRHVVILTNTIRKETGGFASILEMAQTLTQISDVTVQFVILHVDLRFKRHFMRIQQDAQNVRIGFLYAPGYRFEMLTKESRKGLVKYFLSLLRHGLRKLSKSSIREFLEYLIWLQGSEECIRATSVLKDADLIIQAMDLMGGEVTFIRKISSAPLILNHAGSPETYEKYWLHDEHIVEDIDSKLPLYVRFCLGFDRILFQSTLQAEECSNRHPALPARILVLHPTCNEQEASFFQNSDSPYEEDEFSIVNVGVLSPRKAQMDSIDAFGRISETFPNAVLYFLGNKQMWEAYFKALIARVKVLNLEAKVRFLGHRADYLKYMVHADCIIQTSYGEGVSRVLREAMFLKVPIVSYAISGTVDLLDCDRDALLVESGDIEAFSKAIKTLLSNSQLRENLTESAHTKYQTKHSNRVYSRNLEQLLSKVVGPIERT